MAPILTRARWLIACGLAFVQGCDSCNGPRVRPREDAAAPNAHGRVSELPADRQEHDALGRRGDLVLEGSDGARLTVATLADEQGRRPLRGSIVDLSIANHVAEGDSLLWWRVGIARADRSFVAATASTVARMRCDSGGEGIKIVGEAAGARIETHLCARAAGAFEVPRVGLCRAFVDAAGRGDDAALEEDAFGEGRLTGVDMRQDPEVEFCHARYLR